MYLRFRKDGNNVEHNPLMIQGFLSINIEIYWLGFLFKLHILLFKYFFLITFPTFHDKQTLSYLADFILYLIQIYGNTHISLRTTHKYHCFI